MSNFVSSETDIKGLYIIDVNMYGDNRVYFMETFKESDFDDIGIECHFVQNNQSSSFA